MRKRINKLKLKADSIVELMVSLAIFAILSVMLINTLVLNIQISAKINARTRVRSELANMETLMERDLRSSTSIAKCKDNYTDAVPSANYNRCDFHLFYDFYWTNSCDPSLKISAFAPGKVCKRKVAGNTIEYISPDTVVVNINYQNITGNNVAAATSDNILVTLTASSVNNAADGVVNQVRQFSSSSRNYTISFIPSTTPPPLITVPPVTTPPATVPVTTPPVATVAPPGVVVGNNIANVSFASCTSEYSSGWCSRAINGTNGSAGCNNSDWATAGQPTGTLNVTLPFPMAVNGVKIYDRACPERVLSGRVLFSDGSAPISFGALEDTGTVPTIINFAPKTLTVVTFRIDSSTGGSNPGFSEVEVYSTSSSTLGPDLALNKTVSCTSEYINGWCQRAVDGQTGAAGCNNSDWATAGQPSGNIRINFGASTPVNLVRIYDRACAEQVQSGTVKFSDGSMISFLQLEDSGTTPTVLSFPTKNTTFVDVTINGGGSGANQGLSEVQIYNFIP